MDQSFAPPSNLDAGYRPFPGADAWESSAAILPVFDAVAARLSSALDEASTRQRKDAVDFAVRAAAFDTGAIEGLYGTDRGVTFSVAAQTAAWEAQIAQASGRDAAAHFAAQLRGFELVLDAATSSQPISAAWLRALHETICAGQETYRALTAVGWQDLRLPVGEFKRLPNHVLTPDGAWHSYAPVDLTASEVQRFVDELASARFEQLHPASQAAFAHCALVAIHPFADGNGRVARAVGSAFLYRAARVPLLIFADQRPRYLKALRAVDDGEPSVFVRFVAEAAVDTMELLLQQLPDEGADGDHAAERLGSVLADNVTEELHGTGSVHMRGTGQVDIAYGGEVGATISIARADEPWGLRITATDGHHRVLTDELRLRVDQVSPTLSTIARERLRLWARGVVRSLYRRRAG